MCVCDICFSTPIKFVVAKFVGNAIPQGYILSYINRDAEDRENNTSFCFTIQWGLITLSEKAKSVPEAALEPKRAALYSPMVVFRRIEITSRDLISQATARQHRLRMLRDHRPSHNR